MAIQQRPTSIIPWTNALARYPRHGVFPSIIEEMFDQLTDFSAAEMEGLTVSEDKTHVFVEAALPGINSEDIEVTLEKGGLLRIRGEKKEEEDKEKRYHRRALSSYSYRLTLPSIVDESKEPKAIYEKGLIKLTFSKANNTQAKRIAVQKGA